MSHNPYTPPVASLDSSSDAAPLQATGPGVGFDDLPRNDRWRFMWGASGGLVVGFAALWQLIRWCFRTNWFGYRLRLVKA